MQPEDASTTPERLTEELQRQDWQERIANLKLNLDFLRQQRDDEEIAQLEREEKEGKITGPEWYPPGSFPTVADTPEGLTHYQPPPLFLRLPPEKQKELSKAWKDQQKALSFHKQPRQNKDTPNPFMNFIPALIALISLWWSGNHPVLCWSVTGAAVISWLISKTLLTSRDMVARGELEKEVYGRWGNIFGVYYFSFLLFCFGVVGYAVFFRLHH